MLPGEEWRGPTDPAFAREIAAFPGAEAVSQCMQCGVCSGSCPMAAHMTDPPRRLMAHIIAGDRERALQSDSIWYCINCYTCAVRCPQGISITDVMAALKSLAAPRVRNVSTAFYDAFAQSVLTGGRTYELAAAMRVGMARGPGAMFKLAPMGLGMLRRGRMHLKQNRIAGADEVKALYRAVKARRSTRRQTGEEAHHA
ncbi:MAG: 4Fe-4S dicluster domain-containing protein [Mycobacterium leprae]